VVEKTKKNLKSRLSLLADIPKKKQFWLAALTLKAGVWAKPATHVRRYPALNSPSTPHGRTGPERNSTQGGGGLGSASSLPLQIVEETIQFRNARHGLNARWGKRKTRSFQKVLQAGRNFRKQSTKRASGLKKQSCGARNNWVPRGRSARTYMPGARFSVENLRGKEKKKKKKKKKAC